MSKRHVAEWDSRMGWRPACEFWRGFVHWKRRRYDSQGRCLTCIECLEAAR